VLSVSQLRHLFFEDFMEAIVRVACISPLPSADDIAELGCADGGDYLQNLKIEGDGVFDDFMNERRQDWAREPPQEAWRCVDHLVMFLIREVETMVGGEDGANHNLIISKEEANSLVKMTTKGEKQKRTLHRMTTRKLDVSITAAAAAVKLKVMNTLWKVGIFKGIKDEELESLRDAMSHVCAACKVEPIPLSANASHIQELHPLRHVHTQICS
jgi:hypothetical protein